MISDIKGVFQNLFWLLLISGQNCIRIYENNLTFVLYLVKTLFFKSLVSIFKCNRLNNLVTIILTAII